MKLIDIIASKLDENMSDLWKLVQAMCQAPKRWHVVAQRSLACTLNVSTSCSCCVPIFVKRGWPFRGFPYVMIHCIKVCAQGSICFKR